MRIVIGGGGMAGLVLARALDRRGIAPVVLERAPAGIRPPGPIMLPFQAFDALADIGCYEPIHAAGWEIGRPGDPPVAISVARAAVLDTLAAGVPVRHEMEVVDLLREGSRVTGVVASGPEGREEIAADLVVGADGTFSTVRGLAGIPAELRPSPGAGLSFRSPVVIDRAFAMAYQSDGRQVGLLGWPGGSAGWWQIDRIGREAALAPGVGPFKERFARLLPAAAAALEGVTSVDQLIYREVTEVARCDEWWRPGVIVIGEAAHAIDPESGVGAGLGLGDAHALAVAIESAADADTACRDYEFWRRPAVAPYTAIGARGSRVLPAGGVPAERPDRERWPPID